MSDKATENDVRLARRRIRLSARGVSASAEIEDNFHHFRLELRHRDGIIRQVTGEAIRFPWGSCGGATGVLASLAGKPLAPLVSHMAQPERYHHCTHLFDLASLAVDHVLRGGGDRLYLAEIHVAPGAGPFKATIDRDGQRLFAWQIADGVIAAPALFAGVPLKRLPHWARTALSPDETEAALALRRAIHVGRGVGRDLDIYKVAADMGYPATCYTFEAGHAETAARLPGSFRAVLDWPEDAAARSTSEETP